MITNENLEIQKSSLSGDEGLIYFDMRWKYHDTYASLLQGDIMGGIRGIWESWMKGNNDGIKK